MNKDIFSFKTVDQSTIRYHEALKNLGKKDVAFYSLADGTELAVVNRKIEQKARAIGNDYGLYRFLGDPFDELYSLPNISHRKEFIQILKNIKNSKWKKKPQEVTVTQVSV